MENASCEVKVNTNGILNRKAICRIDLNFDFDIKGFLIEFKQCKKCNFVASLLHIIFAEIFNLQISFRRDIARKGKLYFPIISNRIYLLPV